MMNSIMHRNNKQKYYLINYLRLLIPDFYFRLRLNHKLKKIAKSDFDYIKSRVNYYNKLDKKVYLPDETPKLKSFKIKNFHRTYFFDTHEYSRFFKNQFKLNMLFGDIVHIPNTPSIVKSRPISDQNNNSILFKLNKIRHFTYTNDKNNFKEKNNLLIGRSAITKKHKKRIKFFKKYFDHKLCDLGKINNNEIYNEWLKPKISIEDHLKYKFIMCVEGVDVATNLKWVMSSNSIAVMPKPEIESWFMEKKLIAGFHYIEIKKDYSDLEEKLKYYLKDTEKCLEIIKNANEYVSQFKHKKREDIISLLVLKKYFYYTNQINEFKDLDY